MIKIKEEWRDIINYEGSYQISSYGRVKSLNRTIVLNNGKERKLEGKIRAYGTDKAGYPITRLSTVNKGATTFTIHRLMAKAFLEFRDELYVNHIDGDKSNNKVSNLEMISASDNIKHAFKLGLCNQSGERNGYSKLTKEDVIDIKLMLRKGMKNKDIATKYPVGKVNISQIKRGYTWKHIIDSKEMNYAC